MSSRRLFLEGVLAMELWNVLGKPAIAKSRDESTPALDSKEVPNSPKGAVSQLVGANAISPVFDPGFGLEKHLMHFDALMEDFSQPQLYKRITPRAGSSGHDSRIWFDQLLTNELTGSFQFVVTYYGRDVEGFNMFMWKGVRMDGLNVVAGFTDGRSEAEAKRLWRDDAYLAYGLTSKPVVTHAPGRSGWNAINAGWSLIAAPESKVIWQTSVDAPSHPKGGEPNEAAIVLMVGHANVDTGRKPLAYFSAIHTVPMNKELKRKEGETLRQAAIRMAIEKACAEAEIDPLSIRSLASDCGKGSPEAAKRLADLGAVAHDLMPDIDVLKDRIDMAALLGELGAHNVTYTLLMAAYAAHQRNHPVLYVSTRDPDAGRAMIVFPPMNHTPPDPNRKFREHNARGQWYAPWWGQRLDGKQDY